MTLGHFHLFKHMAEIEKLKVENEKLRSIVILGAKVANDQRVEIMHLSNELESERMRRLIHAETHRGTA